MNKTRFFTTGLALVLYAGQTAYAQTAAPQTAVDRDDPDSVLAYKGAAVVTQTAIDAAFSRIPEQYRLAFIRDGAKVDHMLQSLLQTRLIALEAEKDGFDQQALVQERMRLAAEKELAEAWVAEVMRRAPAADYAAMARESYLANPAAYRPDATLDVSHLLLDMKQRSPAEALELAEQLRRQLDQDPSAFNAMVMEYSDDPAKPANFGRYESMTRGQMVKPFEQAAFALTQPGQISEPVKTEFGYHLIRLNARQEGEIPPFEAIREPLEAEMQAKHLEAYRARYVQNLMKDPLVIPEGAVEVMLRRHFGDHLENAPVFSEEGPLVPGQE